MLNKSDEKEIFSTLDQAIKNNEFGNTEKNVKKLLNNNFPMVLIIKHIVETFKEKKLIKIIEKVSNECLRSFCNQENKMDGHFLKWVISCRNPKFVLKIFRVVKNRDSKFFKNIFICNNSYHNKYINNPLVRILNQYKYNNNFSKDDSRKYLIELLKYLDEKTLRQICNNSNDFSNVMLCVLRHAFSEHDDFVFEIMNHLSEYCQMILCEKHIIGYSNLLLLSAEKGSMATVKKLFNLKRIKHQAVKLLTMRDYYGNTFLELMIESGEFKKITFIIDELEKMQEEVFASFCIMPLYENEENNSEDILMYLLENINQYDKYFHRLLNKINRTSASCHEFHQISSNQLKKIEKKNRVFVMKSMECVFNYRILEEKYEKLNNSLYELDKKKKSILETEKKILSRDENILMASIYAKKIIKLKRKVFDQAKDKEFKKKCFQKSFEFSEKYNLEENLENLEMSFNNSNEKYIKLSLDYINLEKETRKLLNPFDLIHSHEKKHKEKIKLISFFLFLFHFQEEYKKTSKEYAAFQKKNNPLFVECYPLPGKNAEKENSNKELKYSHSTKSIRQFARLNNTLKNLEIKYVEYIINAQKTYGFYKEEITKKLNNKKIFGNNRNFNELQIKFNRFYGKNITKQENEINILDQTQMLLCLLRMYYSEISVDKYVEFLKKEMQITDNIQTIAKEMTELENKKYEIDIQEHRCILEIYMLFSDSDQNRIQAHTNQAASQKRIIH